MIYLEASIKTKTTFTNDAPVHGFFPLPFSRAHHSLLLQFRLLSGERNPFQWTSETGSTIQLPHIGQGTPDYWKTEAQMWWNQLLWLAGTDVLPLIPVEVFLVVMLCSVAGGYQCSGGPRSLYLQGEVVVMPCSVAVGYHFRWPCCLHLQDQVTSIWILNAVKTSNLAHYHWIVNGNRSLLNNFTIFPLSEMYSPTSPSKT